jgi:hypothetical protein
MEESEKYEAGLCNIGRQEINFRKKLFNFSLLFALMMTCMSFSFFHHSWMMVLLFSAYFFTILLLIEIRLKFCIFFGIFNVYNFNKPGQLENIQSHKNSRKDRLKAIKILSFTALASVMFTYLEYWLVTYLYV